MSTYLNIKITLCHRIFLIFKYNIQLFNSYNYYTCKSYYSVVLSYLYTVEIKFEILYLLLAIPFHKLLNLELPEINFRTRHEVFSTV